jgi:hypothetical protein
LPVTSSNEVDTPAGGEQRLSSRAYCGVVQRFGKAGRDGRRRAAAIKAGGATAAVSLAVSLSKVRN